jgi:hypothetical protein
VEEGRYPDKILQSEMAFVACVQTTGFNLAHQSRSIRDVYPLTNPTTPFVLPYGFEVADILYDDIRQNFYRTSKEYQDDEFAEEILDKYPTVAAIRSETTLDLEIAFVVQLQELDTTSQTGADVVESNGPVNGPANAQANGQATLEGGKSNNVQGAKDRADATEEIAKALDESNASCNKVSSNIANKNQDTAKEERSENEKVQAVVKASPGGLNKGAVLMTGRCATENEVQ